MIETDLLLAWGATYKQVAIGEHLFKEGQECNFYHQVESGQFRWVNIDDDGKEYLQRLVEPGESIGELPLFDGGKFAATAIAIKESLVLRLHKPVFYQLLKSQPEIHFAFSKLLTERLRFKFFMLKEMGNHDPEKMIISFLNYLKGTCDHICTSCNKIKLTRKQISEMTSLRVETVIRVMRRLQEKQMLQIKKGKVYFGESKGCIENCDEVNSECKHPDRLTGNEMDVFL